MSGQAGGTRKNGGGPSKNPPNDKRQQKKDQQKADKKARIAAAKNTKKADEPPREEAGPSHRFQPLPHSLETTPQYTSTSDSEEENLLRIAADFFKNSNNNNSQERPNFGGPREEVDDLGGPAVIRHLQERNTEELNVAGLLVQMASGRPIHDDTVDPDEQLAAMLRNPEQQQALLEQERARREEEEAKKAQQQKNRANRRKRNKINRKERDRERQANGASPDGQGGATPPEDAPQAAENPTSGGNLPDLDNRSGAAEHQDGAARILGTDALAPANVEVQNHANVLLQAVDAGNNEVDPNQKPTHKKKKKQNRQQSTDQPQGQMAEKTPDEQYRELFGDDYEGASKNNKKKNPAAKQKPEPKKGKKSRGPVSKNESKESTDGHEEVDNIENGHAEDDVSTPLAEPNGIEASSPVATDHPESKLLAQAAEQLKQLEIETEELASSSDNDYTPVLPRNKRKKYASGTSSNASLSSKNSPVVTDNNCTSPKYNERNIHPQNVDGNHTGYRKRYERSYPRKEPAPIQIQTTQRPMYIKTQGSAPPSGPQQDFPPLPTQNSADKANHVASSSSSNPANPWNKQKEKPSPAGGSEAKTPWTGNRNFASTVANGGKINITVENSANQKDAFPSVGTEPSSAKPPTVENGVAAHAETSAPVKAPEPAKVPEPQRVPEAAPVNPTREQSGPRRGRQQKGNRGGYRHYNRDEDYRGPPPMHVQPAFLVSIPPPVDPNYMPHPSGANPAGEKPPPLGFRLFDINVYKEERQKMEDRTEQVDTVHILPGSRRSMLATQLSAQDWDDLLAPRHNTALYDALNSVGLLYDYGMGIAGTGLLDMEESRRAPHTDYSMTFSNAVGIKIFNQYINSENTLIEIEREYSMLKNEQQEIDHAKEMLMEQICTDSSFTALEKELLTATMEYNSEKIAAVLRKFLPNDKLADAGPFAYANFINKAMAYVERKEGISVFHLLCATKKKEDCSVVELLFEKVPHEMITGWLNTTDYNAHRNGLHFAAISGYSYILAVLYPYLGNSALNRRDSMGYTPLDYAAQRNNLEVVRLLQLAGVDLTMGPFVTVTNEATDYLTVRRAALSNAMTAWMNRAYKNIIQFREPATAAHFIRFEAGHQGRVQFELPREFLEVPEETSGGEQPKSSSLYLAVHLMKYTSIELEMPAKHPHAISVGIPKRLNVISDARVTDKGNSQPLAYFATKGSGYAYKLPTLTGDKPVVSFQMDPQSVVQSDRAENLIIVLQMFVAATETRRDDAPSAPANNVQHANQQQLQQPQQFISTYMIPQMTPPIFSQFVMPPQGALPQGQFYGPPGIVYVPGPPQYPLSFPPPHYPYR